MLKLWYLVSNLEIFKGNVNYIRFFLSCADFETYLLQETCLHCNLLVLVCSY